MAKAEATVTATDAATSKALAMNENDSDRELRGDKGCRDEAMRIYLAAVILDPVTQQRVREICTELARGRTAAIAKAKELVKAP